MIFTFHTSLTLLYYDYFYVRTPRTLTLNYIKTQNIILTTRSTVKLYIFNTIKNI